MHYSIGSSNRLHSISYKLKYITTMRKTTSIILIIYIVVYLTTLISAVLDVRALANVMQWVLMVSFIGVIAYGVVRIIQKYKTT